MIVGVYAFEIHLPASGSLKEKRQTVRRLKDRLRTHNLSIVEDPVHAELWQRARLTVCALGHNRDVLERLFDTVMQQAESLVPGQVMECGADFLPLNLEDSTSWAELESSAEFAGDTDPGEE